MTIGSRRREYVVFCYVWWWLKQHTSMLLVFCSALYVTTNWLRYTNRYAQRFAVRYTLQPTECSKLTVMKFCRPSGQFCFLNEFILSTIVYICCWWYNYRKSFSVVSDNTVLPNLCSECISHGKCICLALTIPYSPWDFHDSTFMHHGQLPQCVLWELSTNSNSLQSFSRANERQFCFNSL